MTLAWWLRDYLYVPLGGSRGSPARTYRNVLITMALGGLWHGAAWTFVAWGLLHGAGLAAGRWREARAAAGGTGAGSQAWLPASLPPALHRAATVHSVCLGWLPVGADPFPALGPIV